MAALAPAAAQASSSGPVISQVYTSGGLTGATYQRDYIELFNGGPVAVDVTGYSVQYADANDSFWSDTPLNGVTLAPGQYYLVAEASGGATGDTLSPNVTGIIDLDTTAGKVALVSSGTSLSGSCPTDASIVDFVGYGAGTCHEGFGPAPSPAATTAIKRGEEGCKDSDNNSVDFGTASTVSNPPRSTLSNINDCYVTLTVTKAGDGSGTVSGPGLSCSANCTHRYPKGTPVTLTATPGGSVFSGWSGDCSGQSCELTMDADRSVTATFDPDSPPVLAAVGNRSVTAGQTLSFQLSATDANGDPLTYEGNNLPDGATVSEAGAFSWTPTLAQVGVYDAVRMQVADNRDGGDFEDITITVSAPELAASQTSMAVAKKGKKHHRRYKVSGLVTPSDPGTKMTVKLLRKQDGAFDLVKTLRPALSASSRYAATFKRPGAGKCEVTADYPGTSGVAASRALKKFRC
jgi:hypothetical protein